MELNEGYQAVLEELFGNSQSSPSSPSPSDVSYISPYSFIALLKVRLR